ncbi:unnamed protein product [Haemonchus placei]|uniref:THO complex subunit 5 n=1 Tax=Haemonchus placei TaxID=6290 RepID=A0A0N4WP33_HAEPC|nr:unnamed protein product [Haemonchus placei]
MEDLRHDFRSVKEELYRFRQELDNKTQELRELHRALPLPDPQRLYSNIIDLCHEFHSRTTRTTELDNRIRALRQSKDSYENRLHESALLELQAEKLRVEIAFIRSQLRTFFTVPSLLCATRVIKMDVWRAWMDRPQRNEAGYALLVQPEDIERVAADQLQQLDRYRQMIIEIRASITDEQREDSVNFQSEMRAAVAQLQSSLDSALAAIEQRQRATPAPEEKNIPMEERDEESIRQDQHSRHPSPAPEDEAMQEQEQEAIQENAEFLEEVRPEEAASVEEREEDREGAQARIRRQYAQMRRRIVQKIQELE